MRFSFIQRVQKSVRNAGLVATARRAGGIPSRLFRSSMTRYRRWKLEHSTDPRVVFSMIRELNIWDDSESVSGPGSTLAYTESLRRTLPTVFERYLIGRMLDAPCGDFNWMRKLVAATPIDYIGGDIVPDLIAANQRAHGSGRIRFQEFDITRDPLPDVDLWFCRDCLFHLSLRQIHAALQNFAASKGRYILVTNHRDAGAGSNRDIRTGGFRKLDLMAAPFHLPADVRFRIQEGPAQDSDHEMCLWEREQIVAALPRFKAALDSLSTSPAE